VFRTRTGHPSRRSGPSRHDTSAPPACTCTSWQPHAAVHNDSTWSLSQGKLEEAHQAPRQHSVTADPTSAYRSRDFLGSSAPRSGLPGRKRLAALVPSARLYCSCMHLVYAVYACTSSRSKTFHHAVMSAIPALPSCPQTHSSESSGPAASSGTSGPSGGTGDGATSGRSGLPTTE
jgi:hypothetical protein